MTVYTVFTRKSGMSTGVEVFAKYSSAWRTFRKLCDELGLIEVKKTDIRFPKAVSVDGLTECFLNQIKTEY